MRKRTLQTMLDDAFAKALAQPGTTVDVVTVVEVRDFPQIQHAFERNRVTIATQNAEIATLRMLLKEALGQLERHHEISKIVAPDYKRLLKRASTALDHTTAKDTPE